MSFTCNLNPQLNVIHFLERPHLIGHQVSLQAGYRQVHVGYGYYPFVPLIRVADCSATRSMFFLNNFDARLNCAVVLGNLARRVRDRP